MKKYQIVILYLLTTLIMLYLSGIASKDSTTFAVNGVIDLHEFNDFTVNALVGEMEFYPNEHIDYGRFEKYKHIRTIENVPSVWNDKMDGFGIATYRLKIVVPENHRRLAIKVLPLSTSFKIMVDDEVVMESGKVGLNKQTSSPKYSSDYVMIQPDNSEFELIVHVSNFVYPRGGMWKQIILGEYDNIKGLEKSSTIIQSVILTLMSTMVIFQAFMYITSDVKRYISLIFCTIGILLRLVVTGEYVILDIIDLPFKILIIIEYLSLYFGFVAWGFFLHSLFEKEFNIIWVRTILYIGIGLFLLTVITPIHFFVKYLPVFWIFDIGCCIYYGHGIIKAIRNKRRYSHLLLYCTYVVIIALVLDEMQYSRYNSMSIYGALVYAGCYLLFILSYIPFSSYVMIREEIKDREFKMLSAQSNPHFLFNSLNSIASLCLKNGVEAYDAIISFSDYLKATYTTSNYNELIDINEEINLITKYLQTEKVRFKNRLNYEIDMDDVLGIKIYPLLIQPLVENAIKHGISKNEEGGKIFVTGKEEDGYIMISVINTGSKISSIEEVLQSKGIGIKSVNRRLQNLGSKLEIQRDDKITKVVMKISRGKLVECTNTI